MTTLRFSPHTSSPISLCLGLCAALCASACSDDAGGEGEDTEETAGEEVGTDTETDTGEEVEVDEQAILDSIASYREDFVLINAAAFTSEHGGATVNVYAEPGVADAFRAIDPENPVDTTLPVGALIVKEVIDEMGDPVSGTVMFKAEAGYNPELGDWWFGAGDLIGGELSASGPDVGNCVGCHQEVAQTDYVYGVPPADQT
ncbi:cytochrome P460 family protein [Pseudenhygromyxa sp. WMMC2535]|uniref:cytochrome P460 family protein n=1 Tax=Pseudenhygromyxa sp. WMMC2535 TaxID=2712867 RepID=UPI0015538BEC|nr:cytochrome P460 family protein [Pseudenhygromyxa sp. WMMC2535]NVB39453.1 cytochrome P460 family protein [Pseudenhygromyxa sp. WMMC2535]